eukprot:TRINITY_DN141_c0_g1_i7.p1 TRINITY_DN141_c0_g1~~TRINITY_DN141_c0_g1_i7.p1  ORF type:complete len:1200 (+),score=259.78 TRINITY_DN141_c0_g1_i7:5299-8898(+)
MTASFLAICETLMMVLGHSLWQATAIAIVVGLLLRGLSARHANWRYAIAVGGLVSIVLAAFATWSALRLDFNPLDAGPPQIVAPTRDADVVIADKASPAMRALEHPSHTSQWLEGSSVEAARLRSSWEWRHLCISCLACLWGAGAILMLARGVIGHVTVRKWLAEPTIECADVLQLQLFAKELSHRLGLKQVVRVMASHRLSVPAVVGFWSPVILIPPAMLTGIPVDQWRIILAHELAHVRRWDAIVNLAQLVIESLLFFNPAVWWISRQIRVEREACCDALAAAVCGEPVAVAWALLGVASAVTQGRSQMTPLGGLAFAEPANEGELTDRVRRLIDPNRMPRSKVSWIGLVTVLIAIAGAALVLSRSTDLAVRAAAAWMSPKERVDRLVRLEAERNGNFLPLAGTDDKAVPGTERMSGAITVNVVIKMKDGSNVPKTLNWGTTYRTGNSTSSMSHSPPTEDVAEYRKGLSFPPSELLISAVVPGGGAGQSPVIPLFAGDEPHSVELVIKAGKPVPVSVRNESGEPLPNARLQVGFESQIRGSGSTMGFVQLQADGQGTAVIDHVVDGRYALEVQAAGYQRRSLKEAFSAAQSFTRVAPYVITMKAARPTVVQVVDAATGKGIEGAKFRIAHIQQRDYGWGYGFRRDSLPPDVWYDYATSGEDGRAVLDQLRDDANYTFVILAEGYAATLLESTAGQSEQVVKLRPPLRVSGQLTGSLERLPRRTDGKPGYQFGVNSRLTGQVNDYRNILVDEEGRFTLDGYSQGEQLSLNLPDEPRNLTLKESRDDLNFVIKPAAGPDSIPRRDVVIRLTGVSPEAPARGTLYVGWQHPTVRADNQSGFHPLKANEIRLSVPVGARLNFREQEVAGYRISDRDQIEIPAGAEPLVIDAPVTVLGGIHGTIKRADGSPAGQAFVRVFPIRLPRGVKENEINPSSSRGGSEYLREVPLGGRYRILAREETADGYVWGVSGEISIDPSNPIHQADIQLPEGRDLAIKVVDDRGNPVVNQEVSLEVSFQLRSSTSGTSTITAAKTDESGIVTFKRISADQKIEPLTCTLTAIVKPVQYRGERLRVDPRKPNVVQLKKGLTATGTVIDAASGRPIPGAEVRLIPKQFKDAQYQGDVTTTTDSQGRFLFGGLEPIAYRGFVNDTSPKGSIVEPLGPGYRIRYSNGVDAHSLSGGEANVRWEVVIHPGKKLEPLE